MGHIPHTGPASNPINVSDDDNEDDEEEDEDEE